VTDAAAPRRRWWKYALIVVGAGLLSLFAALWYIHTDSFQAYVRRRMIEEVERITAGRAEIGSFHVVPFQMQVEVRDITVHGSEGPNEVPLAHADHLIAKVKVVSLLRTEFGFHSVVLDHPVVHVAIAPDGRTNIPVLNFPLKTTKSSLDALFSLSIDHLSVRNGELLWADRRIPLDFDVRDAGAQMDYSYLRGRYETRLSVGKVDTVFEDCRPFAWSASAQLSLAPNFADVEALQWNSGRSSVEARGKINNFQDPHLDGSYTGHFDLQEAAAIARRQDLRQGSADFSGSGRWSLDEFNTSGAIALRDLAWQNEQVVVRKASSSADYAITDQQIKLTKLQGKVFGGSFTGDAQVDNWLHSIPPEPVKAKKSSRGKPAGEEIAVITAEKASVHRAGKEKLPGVQVGAVHLRVRDVSAAEMATAVDVPAHPLRGFHPVGLAAGSINVNWRGSPKDAEVAFAFDVTAPAPVLSRELPITAHTQGKYRAAVDELELTQFALSTPESRIQASGMLSTDSTVHFSVSTSNLEEWRPLVRALGGPTNLPFRIDGHASLNGVAAGTLSAPTLTGTIVAQDFEFTVPATSFTPQQDVHWDSLASNVQLSSRDLLMRGGSLRRGETSADFDVTAILKKGQFTEDSPFTARVNLHRVDVASTAALAGFDYPVTGIADVVLQIAGTRAHPQVQGHIRAANASAYGEAIEAFDADLHISNGETALNNIHLTHQEATVSGMAAYTPETRGFRLDLVGKNFDLARVRQIHFDRVPIEGRGDFTLQGSGTLAAPAINARIQMRGLTFDHELAGGLNLEAVTSHGQLHLSGGSEFLRGSLALDGTVDMRGQYPASIQARLDHLDLDALWRAYFGAQLTGHSAVGGTVTMNGPLRDPKQWRINGNISDVALEAEYVKLHNQGPLHFAYAEQMAQIDRLHLVGDSTDINGGGTIHFAGARELDLSADGQIDLKLLSSMNPNISASGSSSIHLSIGGTLNDPQPQGTIQIKDAAFNYASLPSGLSEMNGSLAFTLDRIHIQQLTARTGGGTLDLKGDATFFNRELNFNVTAVGKDVRLRYPPGVSSTADAELHWVGNRSSSTVSGEVMVTKLAVTPGFDFGSYLERSRHAVVLAPTDSPLYKIKLDVAVHTAPELQMKTAVARLSGDADLKLRGSVARPSVLGRADILEGDATFNGIKFRLERGDITFANPVTIEPQLNMEATTHVRNYDLNVQVTGTPDRLNVNYRSEPPLPKSDIIALLALGRTGTESEQLQQQSGQVPFTDEATALIINQALNQTVSSRMQKLFGVGRIKIDPQGLTTETNPTARGPQVTIEQQFANNLSLTYSTNVSQSSQQIIQGEYFFTRNVSAVGTRDQNGVVSFDLQIRQRKK
jgi:translocation and assembly module TamB